MSSVSPVLTDQLHSWSSNQTASEILSITWSHPSFLHNIGLFCGIIGVFWATTILLMDLPKAFILEHATSLIHATLNCAVSLIFIINHSELELVQMNIERQKNTSLDIPESIQAMMTFLAFQSAYCVMDSLQLLMGIVLQRERIGYRVTLIIHHLLILCCSSGLLSVYYLRLFLF